MQKIIVIGLDSADWEIIRPLMEAGMMPGIKALIDRGASGNIKTLQPALSPLLWTSVATGKRADKHNILGFLEPDETGDTIRPVSSTSRRSRTVWNILQSRNYKCNVIGWWPTHPAEPVNGLMVSNRFHKLENPSDVDWALPEGSVWPINMEAQISKLRVHPSQISPGQVKVFVPEAELVNQEEDNRLQIIQSLMAEALSVFNTTLWALENTQWDFTAVYFNELDVFSHHFMKFHPPQQHGVPDTMYRLYYNVVTAAYTLYDSMIQKILQTVPADATVILMSDHGFYSGERRLKKIPDFSAAIALEHNPNGILCIKGPAIKEKETIYGAGLLDITPTILAICGLPAGADMDGKVLQSIFVQKPDLSIIDSWEEMEGDFGTHAPDRLWNTFGEAQAIKQLADLGYLEELSAEKEDQIEEVTNERNYNLSLVYASAGNIQEALKLVEQLYQSDMVDLRYSLDLIGYSLITNNPGRAREVLHNLKKFDISGLPNFKHLEGKILFAENKKKDALDLFVQAREQSPAFAGLLLDTALAWSDLGNSAKAVAAFKQVSALNPDCIEAYLGLAVEMNKLEAYEEALGFALDALKLDNTNSFGHYLTGVALFRSEEYEAATQALETCLLLHPGMSRARNLLLRIYRQYLPDPEKYMSHHAVFIQSRLGEIVVVSGLPRSGTSMMMQMLSNGGMEILSDNEVAADANNPKGYFEYAPVKKTRTDNTWQVHAEGKAVKVISQLLPHLKMKYRLKVILMERDLDEVIISQQIMLASRNNTTSTFDLGLKETYTRHMAEVIGWAEKQSHVAYLRINYKDALDRPAETAARINHFLGGFLDEEKMSASVDINLYRIKNYEHDTQSL